MPPLPKPISFRDIPIGARVFTLTRMDDGASSHELRETYYTKISETAYLHHGCVQGEEGQLPRYASPGIRESGGIFAVGHEYPMIPTLPVFPIEASRFRDYFPGPDTGEGAP